MTKAKNIPLSKDELEFLETLFLCDQIEEAKKKRAYFQRSKKSQSPAEEWRAIPFGMIKKKFSPLYQHTIHLKEKNLKNIIKNLEKNGFLEIKEKTSTEEGSSEPLYLYIKPKGRKTIKESIKDIPDSRDYLGKDTWSILKLFGTEKDVITLSGNERFMINSKYYHYFEEQNEYGQINSFLEITPEGKEKIKKSYKLNCIAHPE